MAYKYPYLVVRFINESTTGEACVSEIPSNWLVEEKYCYWPKKSKYSINYMLQNRSPPDVNFWTKHEVVIEAECATLEIARKKATELLSSEDEDKHGHGKRNIVRPQKYIESDDDSSSSHQSETGSWRKLTNIPLPPVLNKHNNQFSHVSNGSMNHEPVDKITTAELEIISNTNKVNDIEQIPIIFEDFSDAVPVAQLQQCFNNVPIGNGNTVSGFVPNQQIIFQNIERLLADLKIQNNSIEQRLQHIENMLVGRMDCTSSNTDTDIFVTLLPIKSMEDLNGFEALLTANMDMAVKLNKKLKRIGAQDPKENVQRIGIKVFTNEFLVGCSWKGRSANFKLCDLKVIQIIKDVVMSSFQFYQEVSFDHDMAEWVRFAKQRLKREKTKLGV